MYVKRITGPSTRCTVMNLAGPRTYLSVLILTERCLFGILLRKRRNRNMALVLVRRTWTRYYTRNGCVGESLRPIACRDVLMCVVDRLRGITFALNDVGTVIGCRPTVVAWPLWRLTVWYEEDRIWSRRGRRRTGSGRLTDRARNRRHRSVVRMFAVLRTRLVACRTFCVVFAPLLTRSRGLNGIARSGRLLVAMLNRCALFTRRGCPWIHRAGECHRGGL